MADVIQRYAEAVVQSCARVDDGDLVVVRAEPDHREVVVALVAAGYRAGARLVEVVWADERVAAARVRHGREEDLGALPQWSALLSPELLDETTVTIRIAGDGDPRAFAGLPPARVGAEHAGRARRLRRVQQAAMADERRWTIAAWPTPAWAAQAYPELDADDGRRRLLSDLLDFCRLGPGDPPQVEGWERHAAAIAARGQTLTEARLAGLELRGPGTALDLRLLPGARWLGGPRVTTFGYPFTPNFPTEENHTSPIATSTEGVFRCTRPLSFRGRLIEGISGEFRGGRLVRLDAADEDDRDFFAAALDVDPGGRRLGEVALVDRSSRIGRSGRVYFETLLDENAAAHVAFGAAYPRTRPPELGRRGLNRSLIHVDVMIGSDDFEATGIGEDGRRIQLVADGEWQLP